MDIESHVARRGRAELVKDVRKKINELKIDYIYYQFISVTGRIVGKGVPADHWETIAERGFQLVYGSVATSSRTATATISASGPSPRSWSAFPIPRPSYSSPGTSASGACSAPASAIARSPTTRAGSSRAIAAAICAAPMTTFRRSTGGCTCVTAPNRR